MPCWARACTAPAREEAARVIRDINSSGRPVLAVDVPSGLDSDTGVPLGDTVRADCTVTFVGLKTGLFIGDGPAFAGTVFFDDLEIAPAAGGRAAGARRAHPGCRDPTGAAAPGALVAQGRFRPRADRRRRAWACRAPCASPGRPVCASARDS